MKEDTSPIDFYVQEGIMYGISESHIILDFNTVKNIAKSRLKVCKDEAYPLLYEFASIDHISKDVRENISKASAHGIIAVAYYSRNKTTLTLIRTVLVFEEPKIPQRVFTDKTQAIE